MAFLEDERGVSEIIGALFVFSIVIALLVGWQAVVVPNQNEQVEFNHYRAVQNDLQELRNAKLNAGESGETRAASVTLGTTYPDRAIAQNAAPASGQLTTVRVGSDNDGDGDPDGEYWSNDIDFGNVCGLDTNNQTLRTNHLQYQSGYNYFSEDSPQRIENALYYQAQDASSSGVLNRTTQLLIRPDAGGGGTIRLFPLQDSVSQSGTDRATVEFAGGRTGTVTETDPTLTVPTQLSDDQWETLTGLPDDAVDPNGTSDMVDVSLSGDWTVECTPIGTGEAPAQLDTSAIVGAGGGENQTGTDEINPGNDPEGDLVLLNATKGSQKQIADLAFDPGSDRTVSRIRVPFYYSGGTGGNNKNADAVETIGGSGFTTGSDHSIGDPLTQLSSPINFDASDGNRTISIEFTPNNVNTAGDFFILVMEFDDGSRATYFIAVKD